MNNNIIEIKSISELHRMLGCPPPLHPSVSFVKFSDMNLPDSLGTVAATTHFYIVSLKTIGGQVKYGRNHYDFEEGTMMFSAPNQTLNPENLINDVNDLEGWSLFIQPDLLYGTHLGEKMDHYSYFDYESNEALHLSLLEKEKIRDAINNIVYEYSQNADQHSSSLILTNLELLLNYCKRFYDRQFYTRTSNNKGVIIKIEKLLKNYFNSEKPNLIGLPTVKYCAEEVNLSPNYLSDLLKKETGKSTKEHIDFYLLEKAKNLLLNSELNISEIAYDLGFEYPKSFTKLFKKKNGVSPKEYRNLN